jgi:hypothetical protein
VPRDAPPQRGDERDADQECVEDAHLDAGPRPVIVTALCCDRFIAVPLWRGSDVDSRSHPAGPREMRLARRFGVADHTR